MNFLFLRLFTKLLFSLLKEHSTPLANLTRVYLWKPHIKNYFLVVQLQDLNGMECGPLRGHHLWCTNIQRYGYAHFTICGRNIPIVAQLEAATGKPFNPTSKYIWSSIKDSMKCNPSTPWYKTIHIYTEPAQNWRAWSPGSFYGSHIHTNYIMLPF